MVKHLTSKILEDPVLFLKFKYNILKNIPELATEDWVQTFFNKYKDVCEKKENIFRIKKNHNLKPYKKYKCKNRIRKVIRFKNIKNVKKRIIKIK